jgi:dGTPase
MWDRFLSTHRVGSSKQSANDASRSEFHKDYDRVIFSSAFRRLSDKTQVVPFPKSDYTRQRLTHSLEVSCVGRSLATRVYAIVQNEIEALVSQGDFEAIVATACLAHDIGNPPFGHFGEQAIRDWAAATLDADQFDSLTAAERADLTQFEGNAQSFRVLTRLQMSNRRGGMRLTSATLGTLVKYPRPAGVNSSKGYRKHGYFLHDAKVFDEVFRSLGREADRCGQYARHPLAFLSEAADDICYAIIDLEDGCRAGLIPHCDAFEILENLSPGATGSTEMPADDRLSMGRAMAINELVNQSVEAFRKNMSAILEGTFVGALIKNTPANAAHQLAKQVSVDHVFNSERVLELEAAGYRAIQGLMDILHKTALTDAPSGFDSHVRRLTGLRINETQSLYEKLLACTDNISGMTDRYCIALYHRLSGQA